MIRQILLTTVSALFSAAVIAAPGSLSQAPLFLATPTQPNIFFLLDDSGSMHWSMPSDGVQSSSLIELNEYDTVPDNNKEWRQWCPGANLLAYNPNVEYKPWAANNPNTSASFPDMTDITAVRTNPLSSGSITNTENNYDIYGSTTRTINLSAAPVVTWTDSNNNGTYDAGECPGGNATSGYLDSRVQRADSLSSQQQINFANWFSYYRIREHSAKAAVTQVISTSSARIGMATLHHNNNVGVAITDMTVPANKTALLNDVVNVNSSGGTPLRTSLDSVGRYFSQKSNFPTPSSLNIGSASSPILPASQGGECQQNFAMLMTDGQWNGSTPSGIRHKDRNIDNNYVWPAHRDATRNTLADVAMKWYKQDLAPSLANKVPTQKGDNTQNLDENSQQHLVTFGVAFGPNGTINSDPTDRAQSFTWPVPSSNSATTVDDLRHAAYNGRGKFLSASKPEELISSLQDVISNIESREGSTSAVAFNMSTLSTNTLLFFAGFNPAGWSGNLDAYALDPNTGDLAVTKTWSASSLLNARLNTDMTSNRVIYTSGLNAGASSGVLFKWNTSFPQPTSTILDDFKVNPDLSIDTTPFSGSQNRLDFIRGDTTNNAIGLFRDRSSRLGDIVNSAPLFVASSSAVSASRQEMVYVGSNDGMLHGFSATSGQELMAYVPSSIASTLDNQGLHYLTESDYSHRYYVDGEVVSADVFISKNGATASWRTALVGSLGGGGRGLFALDVSDPNLFANTEPAAQSTFLWEFTDQDEPALGHTYSTPEIVKMNNNQWAVVTGNGYNSTGTDTAQLIIIFIEKGTDGSWSTGDYIKIDTATGTPVNKNGLSTPALVDLDNNGTTDRIYAGDLLGNMWSFNVSDTDPTNWVLAHGATPLFSAGNTKPITMKPLISKPESAWIADSGTNTPNLMVYFGTGQYIASGDPANTHQQTFFGIWDYGQTVISSSLVEQTFLTPPTSNTRLLSQNSVTYNNATTMSSGWFIDLPETGERVTVDAFELEGLIFFNTLTPSNTACSAGGSSWLMSVDKQTGGTPSITSFDFNGDGVLAIDDGYAAGIKFGQGIASKTSVLKTTTDINYGYTSGTANSGSGPSVQKNILPGSAPPATGSRQSWIQLIKN